MAIITGKVVSQTPVYFGPNPSTYPSNNSYAGPNDTVTVFWKENSFYYIEYPAGSKKKRMYIRAAAVSAISGTVSDFVPSLATRYVQRRDVRTYAGPSDSSYPEAGSVDYGEAVSFLDQKENGYAFIEYSISGGMKKRAWVLAEKLAKQMPTPTIDNYVTYKQYEVIPSAYPMGNATVSQGFNDTTTNHKGHLGYDLCNIDNARPLFSGTVVAIERSTEPASGRAVCVSHTVNGVQFYSTYCHLASVDVSIGDSVSTSTNLGAVGGSGHGQEFFYPKHVHVCVYTGKVAQTNPFGYCSEEGEQTFEQTTNYPSTYYYGDDTTKYPRCGGVCFYDPYGVVSSSAAVISVYLP